MAAWLVGQPNASGHLGQHPTSRRQASSQATYSRTLHSGQPPAFQLESGLLQYEASSRLEAPGNQKPQVLRLACDLCDL